jgi:Uma2 family endonuclease
VLVKRIVKILNRHIDESRTSTETGFLIGRRCPQPDIAVIHVDQKIERGWYSGAPLIAIEVASRGNTPDELYIWHPVPEPAPGRRDRPRRHLLLMESV